MCDYNPETFYIKLTVLSPLHVGSGQEILKRNYYYDGKTGCVTFYNMEKLLSILAGRGLADVYEQYIFSAGNPSLDRLFTDCKMSRNDFSSAELCTVSASDALDKDHALKNIRQFMRTADYRPYIPGSSLKGVLRTVYLHHLIKEGAFGRDDLDRKRETYASLIEDRLLGTLPYSGRPKPSNAPLRSVMRGLSVSDSEPVSNSAIMLAGKYDADGVNYEHFVNVVRECARPGTVFRFAVSIDKSLLRLTAEELLEYIKEYFRYYEDTYLSRFADDGPDTLPGQNDCCIFLGAGTGYFSKNIVYKGFGYDSALDFVSFFMSKSFPKHYHDGDKDFGISPHILKCTVSNGSLVQMGCCKVEIEE